MLQCFIHHLLMTSKLNPIEYVYVEDDHEHLIPLIISEKNIPDDFPRPCNCLNCARAQITRIAREFKLRMSILYLTNCVLQVMQVFVFFFDNDVIQH